MKAVLFDGSKDDDTTIGTIRQAIVEQLGRAGWDEEAIDVRRSVSPAVRGALAAGSRLRASVSSTTMAGK